MNNQHYLRILEDFKVYHPYLADGIKDWSPRGEMGIRVLMTDGTKYDYHSISKTIRKVSERPAHQFDVYDEDAWRDVFADRLAELICTKGISQQALAEYSGISKGAINNYINRKATPSAYVITKLARALDCTIMDLTD
jgi:ribosome-binding protein aMBF1 (putative translation factor)